MSFWRRKNPPLDQSLDQRLAKLEALLASHFATPPPSPLETLAVAAVQSVAKNLDSMGGFIGTVGELALSQTAQALGRKGGKRNALTAARRKNGKFARKGTAPACRLCHNPAIPNPSVQEIIDHDRHGYAPPQEEFEVVRDDDVEVGTAAAHDPPPGPPPDVSSWPHVHTEHEGHAHAQQNPTATNSEQD